VEDGRVTSRFRLAWVAGSLTLTLAGCSDRFNAGELKYVESERLAAELKDKPQLADAVRNALVKLFGPNPREIKVPPGSGLPRGGAYLANYQTVENVLKPNKFEDTGALVEGGYGLYRKHCLHCHGVSGAGDGPTSAFLYPRPRDYRKGVFKFTSTGAKPTRADLHKTIVHGLHGTSMPAFESLMAGNAEIEQVIDYVIFLSMRGETELGLIDEAVASDELTDEAATDVARSVFNKWKLADSQVVNPPIPRTLSTRASIFRGRDIFLSRNQTGNRVDCTSCHGPQAVGNGPSFVSQAVFNNAVFNGKISTHFVLSSGELEILQALNETESKSAGVAQLSASLRQKLGITEQDTPQTLKTKMSYVDRRGETATSLDEIVQSQLDDLETKAMVGRNFGIGRATYTAYIDRKTAELWNQSLDDWGNPIRPANLNREVYKGGRRPIDLYWRIAKGINGAKMPAHTPTIAPEQVWDLVNFVLALPYEPKLLEGATLPNTPPPPIAVTRR
jgi:mono/diheme cytochrome c family protein